MYRAYHPVWQVAPVDAALPQRATVTWEDERFRDLSRARTALDQVPAQAFPSAHAPSGDGWSTDGESVPIPQMMVTPFVGPGPAPRPKARAGRRSGVGSLLIMTGALLLVLGMAVGAVAFTYFVLTCYGVY